jgi:hypothetical protein
MRTETGLTEAIQYKRLLFKDFSDSLIRYRELRLEWQRLKTEQKLCSMRVGMLKRLISDQDGRRQR